MSRRLAFCSAVPSLFVDDGVREHLKPLQEDFAVTRFGKLAILFEVFSGMHIRYSRGVNMRSKAALDSAKWEFQDA